VNAPATVTLLAPAKINLFLAVTGRRADGYHDLVSVVAPLDFGDALTAITVRQKPATGEQFSLTCDAAGLPADSSNLVLRAAAAFAEKTGWAEPVAFDLKKQIPLGAGLGGGSSNAVTTTLALNQLSGGVASPEALAELAAELGSDCPLFLAGGPVVMRGRGERVEPLPAPAARRLSGRRVLLFKPGDLGVDTAWAYAQMDARGGRDFVTAAEAERRVGAWIAGSAPAEDLLFNNMEPAVFRKYVALPELLGQLRARFALAAGMSGSGSTCFALLPGAAPVAALTAQIRQAWGDVTWVQLATIR